jgi:hypothetical protein
MPKIKPMSALLASAANIPIQIGNPKVVTNRADVYPPIAAKAW